MLPEGGVGSVACGTGTRRAVLPCKIALPRGSPETVKTAVALQLSSRTGVSGLVVSVVERCFAAGAIFGFRLFLLFFLLVRVLAAAAVAA